MGKTLILIDGHALAFRQFYALERTNMRTSNGTPTWAVYGFFKAIFDLLKNKELKADAIGVTFDVSHKTFRTEKYSEYKSNREAMPDTMRQQMQIIYEGLKAFSIPIYTKEGFEADDVIGTISKKACELGHKVLILTGDQDAFQLVDKEGCIKVILPSKGELVEYNWEKVHEKLGVYPNQVVDYKGLRGDVSDCIPGVKGIGEKTAQKLLERYGTLEAVLADCENIKEKSIREKICNGKEQALLSQYLATIIRDLDVDFDFEKTQIELPNLTTVTEFLKQFQFFTFIKNINAIMTSFDKGQNSVIENSNNGQLTLFSDAVKAEINKNEFSYEQKVITDISEVEDLVKELSNKSLISFKVHADVTSAVRSSIVGISFGYNDNYSKDLKFSEGEITKTYYIPLTHSSMENQLAAEDVFKIIKPILEDEKIKKTTYDAKTDLNVLKCIDINLKGIIFDCTLASYIKDPARNHDIEIQSMENLSHAMCEYSPYEKKKRISFKDSQPEKACDYACEEASIILELTKFWVNNLEEKELSLLFDVEVPLTYVLAEMEYNGVSVDVNYLYMLSQNMEEEISKIEVEIYDLAGEPFNINSPKQVGQILFEKLMLKPKKKRGKANYSTNAAVLEELAEDYEIARLILEYRKFSKLKSTYTDSLPSLIDPKDMRIHTSYNQTTTVTGRLSSSNPNLQNIPIRTPEGNKIRNAFIPKYKDDYLILSADYSQIELRLLAHISQDSHLIEAFKNNSDIHTLTASKVFDVPVEKVTKDMRYKAKAVNFGIIYGQTKYGLSKTLGISNQEAELFINKYFATYPRVKAYMEATIMQAEEKGFVETVFGRKRYLSSELASSNGMIREFAKRAAINQPMQGTAADLMKIAMIDFNKKLKENNLKTKMVMQVHDELILEVKRSELEFVSKLVKEAMELNQPFDIPLVIDINIGESWKE